MAYRCRITSQQNFEMFDCFDLESGRSIAAPVDVRGGYYDTAFDFVEKFFPAIGVANFLRGRVPCIVECRSTSSASHRAHRRNGQGCFRRRGNRRESDFEELEHQHCAQRYHKQRRLLSCLRWCRSEPTNLRLSSRALKSTCTRDHAGDQSECAARRLVAGRHHSQVVEVQGDVSQVDTVSATLGKVETTQRILQLPLVERDTMQLGLLQAGVFAPDQDDGSGNPFSVSGQRSESMTFLLDGADNNDFLGNNMWSIPNPDAVAEFKILTNNYTAEYGRTSGGIVNQVIKSGTNSFMAVLLSFSAIPPWMPATTSCRRCRFCAGICLVGLSDFRSRRINYFSSLPIRGPGAVKGRIRDRFRC